MSFELSNHTSNILIQLPASKSISNRILIIREILGHEIQVKNISEARDTKILLDNIQKLHTEKEFNAQDAGTTFRFLLALFSILPGERILTGNHRMLERPIMPLVLLLRILGAEINCIEKEDFPPFKITGKKILGGEVYMNEVISSQFISALLCIAPTLPQGLIIHIPWEKQWSKSYILLTLHVLQQCGVTCGISQNKLFVEPIVRTLPLQYIVESDWSSASYWYLWVLVNPNIVLTLHNIHKNSPQPDAVCASVFSFFGIESIQVEDNLLIQYTSIQENLNVFEYDVSDCPDLMQTLVVACVILSVKANFKGVKTLLYKETNRLLAMQLELKKIGVECSYTDNSFTIHNTRKNTDEAIIFETYDDHRMAMCLAPLSVLYNISFNNYKVVEKSYPNYWSECEKLGVKFNINMMDKD